MLYFHSIKHIRLNVKHLLVLFFLLTAPQLFAIVTIKPLDVGEDKPGFSGEFALSLDVNRGNSETDSSALGLYIKHDRNNSLIFLKSSYDHGQSAGLVNIDKSFIHVRHIHKLSKTIDDEFFIQQQNDTFQSLNSRAMLGAGLRISTGNPKKTGRIYFGIGAFYLTESETNLPIASYVRTNTYLSYKFDPKTNYNFSLVSYYQPKMSDKSDYLLQTTAEFNLNINKDLAIKLSISYNENSRPVSGVEPYDYSQTTSLKYKF